MEKTIPGTPQQHGATERMNRTPNEHARRMRLHSGLPQSFWANVVNTIVYLVKEGDSTLIDYQIADEIWSGKEVNLCFLIVFSCLSYVYIDSANRTKFNHKCKKCFFIGYGDNKFNYCFWDNQNIETIRSRDVIFNEQVEYMDRSSTKIKGLYLEIKKDRGRAIERYPSE